jgi:hypothetical protein
LTGGPKKSILPAEAVFNGQLGKAAFRTLAALCIFADTKTGECYPSLKTIGDGLGITKQAVHQHIAQLEALGYVKRAPRRRDDGSNSTCKYRVLPRQDSLDPRQGDLDTPSRPELDGPSRPELDAYNDPINDPINDNGAFDNFWTVYPSRENNPKKPAKQKFEAAVNRGISPEDIIRGAQNYAALCQAENKESKFIAQAVTFLNQERWSDFQNLPTQTSGGSSNPAIGTPEHAAAQERWGA